MRNKFSGIWLCSLVDVNVYASVGDPEDGGSRFPETY